LIGTLGVAPEIAEKIPLLFVKKRYFPGPRPIFSTRPTVCLGKGCFVAESPRIHKSSSNRSLGKSLPITDLHLIKDLWSRIEKSS
jgi:hypothetical protein